MTDFIIILVLIAVVGGAGFYLYREKKKGRKCIGCPYSGDCSSKGCHCQEK